MSMPWFLELLQLPPHADERAVRRAYAMRLKSIDPATDPAAFAHLREAYEAARAWAADEDHEVLAELPSSGPREEPLPAFEPPVAEAAPVQAELPTVDPVEQAASLVDRFAERIARGSRGDVRGELENCTAELRLQYIDAPGIFEEVLIDRLARGLLEKRAVVFTHASEHFHWQEIGHLASLGPKGAWIDAVESQRMIWISQAKVPGRANRLSLIEQADAARGGLPMEIVRRWFDVRDDFQRFPAYLGLYLTVQRQHEWAASYDALPAPVKQAIEARARKRWWRLPGRASLVRAWGWFFLAMAAGLIYLLQSAATIGPSRSSTTGPVVRASAAALGRASGLDVVLSEPTDPARQGRGWIVVTLSNHGAAPLYLDRALTPPMTPTDRLARSVFTVIDAQGVPASFVHPYGPPGPIDAGVSVLPLEPGRTLTSTIPLGSLYKLPRRSYMVSYRQPVLRSNPAYAQGTIPEDPAYVDSNQLFITVKEAGDTTSR